MKVLRVAMAAMLALCATQWSSACSIAKLSHEVGFPEGVAALSSGQVRSITNWYVDLRDGPFGVSHVNVYSASIEDNEAHFRLVDSRVGAVASLLRTLSGTGEVAVSARVSKSALLVVRQFPEVFVAVQPRCAATHSCCGPDPSLRKADPTATTPNKPL